ncbi:TonB-dependent receptor [Arhodomonas sp. AD133]|uniref:TonB-dependent receptor n=1 Tax=Arhodomonas sp. AD133 TaxID=3415009 RepID=UPI003EB76169
MREKPRCVAPFTLLLVVAATADAEESADHSLAPITVTAEKTPSTGFEVPAALTVLTGDELRRSGSEDTLDVVQRVPNLHMIRAGHHSDAGFLSLRGITPAVEGKQSIGFFIDGVHYTTFDTELLDVERVEVLRGPQGTLYGRNTGGGVINVITRDPQPYPEAEVSVGVGSDNRRSVEAVAGGALGSPSWSYRGAARVQVTDGYFTRRSDGRDDVDERNDSNGRFKVRWNPSGKWDVTTTLDAQRYRDGSTSFAPVEQVRRSPGEVNSDFVGEADTDVYNASVHAEYKAHDVTVTAISAATREDKREHMDMDFTAEDRVRLHLDTDISRLSQELRFASPEGRPGPRWLAGLYYFDEEDDRGVDTEMRQGMPSMGVPPFTDVRSSVVDTRGYAAFGQVTWPVSDRLELTGGLRYDRETQDLTHRSRTEPDLSAFGMAPSRVEDREAFDAWLPRFTARYALSRDRSAYASIARGYNSGGFNTQAPENRLEFDPEYTTNYELGMKARWLDGRLRTDMALFWIEWKDQQVEQQLYPQSVTQNAGRSRSRGVELELAWRPVDAFLLQAGVGYNDAHFVEYTDTVYDPDTGQPVGHVDYSGKRPPNAPRQTFSLAAEYRFTDDVYLRADWLGTGRFYYDLANEQKEDAYQLLNLRLGYDNGRFAATAWVNNATDEVYATRAFELDDQWFARAGEPRSVGISVTGRW